MAETTVIEESATLVLPAAARRTAEQSEGRPTVHRFFSDLVVVAASLTAADASVGSMAGEVVVAYSHRPGFARSRFLDVSVRGADAAVEFDMRWLSDSGDQIASTVRVASGPAFGVVLHATCPALFEDQNGPVVRDIVESLRLDGPRDRAT